MCAENKAEQHNPGSSTFQVHSGYTHQRLGSDLCCSALVSAQTAVCDVNARIKRIVYSQHLHYSIADRASLFFCHLQ